jgi:hypothetical protein
MWNKPFENETAEWDATEDELPTPVCTEILIRVDAVMESPKLAE